MVLLESALAIPLLLLVALIGLGVARAAVEEVLVVSAARDGALAAARGASSGEVVADLTSRLPEARVRVQGDADTVTVLVERRTRPLPWLGFGLDHRAASVAARESARRR